MYTSGLPAILFKIAQCSVGGRRRARTSSPRTMADPVHFWAVILVSWNPEGFPPADSCHHRQQTPGCLALADMTTSELFTCTLFATIVVRVDLWRKCLNLRSNPSRLIRVRSHDKPFRCRAKKIKWVASYQRERRSYSRRLQNRSVVRIHNLHPIYLIAD